MQDTKKEYINLNYFVLQKRIGQGSYSKVYQIKEKETGEIYAAKVSIEEIDYSTSEHLIDLSREITIISQLDHPSVLRFKGFSPIDFKKRSRPVIITEYAQNGSLEDLILSERQSSTSIFDDTLKLIIIYGIASAMSYLHFHDIIHRDLKPGNILIDKYLFPKIADFGLSKIKHSNLESIQNNSGIGCVKGTPIYMSPEIWKSAEYSKASDVYAFSIIVYEIVTNRKPFEGFHSFQIPLKLEEGYRPEFERPVSDSFKKLITSCWNDDPSLRPSFHSILDQLRNDNGFITEKVDKEKYHKYINYIDEFKVSFNQQKTFDFFDIYSKIKLIDQSQFNEYFSMKSAIYPFKDFIKLDEKCRYFVLKSENNPHNMFKLSQYLIEGQELFPRNPQIGIKYLKASIKSGLIEASNYYIRILIKGEIIHRDIDKAKKLLERMIKDKDPGNYYFLHGKISLKEKNYDESLKYFEKSISFGNQDAVYEYGRILFHKKVDVADTKDEGILYIQKAANNNCIRAMYKYGLFLLRTKFPIIEEKGLKYIQLAADLNYSDALYLYSSLLYEGYLIPKDEEESFLYLKKAAYKGHVISMQQYGEELMKNDKDIKNLNESVLFIKKASDAGNIEAIYRYGLLFEKGIGVPIDQQKATLFWKIAANNGNTDAMLKYSSILLQDNDYLKFQEAFKFIKMAVDKGNHNAFMWYALLLQFGLGCPKNKEESIKYYKMAIAEGYQGPMTNYADMLREDESCPMNKEEAIKYYKIAIDKGDSGAMIKYADMLRKGEGCPMNKEEAIKYYKMAIDKGDPEAMTNYADMLRNGEGCPMNKEEAIKYYKMAINEGDSEAMTNYADMLRKGEGCSMNKEEAIKYYKMAIEEENSDAMTNYATMCLKGEGCSTNIDEGIKYLKMAIDYENTEAIIIYSLMLIKLNEDGNNEEAIKYLKIAIDKGNTDSMVLYASLLRTEEFETEEAIKYYKMAIDKGNSDAMTNYADMLREGEDCPMDKEEAIKYYKMAIDKGNSEAMTNYADMLREGEGCPINKEEAIKYYKMAIDKGDSEAMTNYAVMLKEGEGCPMNKEEAIKYFKMAIDKGHTKATTLYAIMLYTGDGVSINKEEAIKYLKMTNDEMVPILLNDVGLNLKKGKGYEEAAKYFEMAIILENPNAMANYGYALEHGEGVPENKEEAIKYYKMAIERNDSYGMLYYGKMLLNEFESHNNTDDDDDEWIEYIMLSINEGNADAMFFYATLLDKGDHVPVDKEEAIKYYIMASENGNKEAEKVLNSASNNQY